MVAVKGIRVRGKAKSSKPAKAMAAPKTKAVTVVQSATPRNEYLYKRLLLDPCNAELPPSPYGDETGTEVVRSHWVFNNFNDSMCFFWHPWFGLFRHAGAPGTPACIFPIGSGQANVSAGGRALAGCVEATYTGAENARAGVIQCGIVPGTLVSLLLDVGSGGKGQTVDIANISQYIPNIERTPVDKCAVNWFPAEADAKFIPPVTFDAASASLVQSLVAQTHFVVVFVSGAGANNIRLSMTPINEAAPVQFTAPGAGNSAAVWTVTPKSSVSVNVAQVVRSLAQRDSMWYINTFKKVANFGIGLVQAGMTMGLPGALGYLTRAAVGGPEFGGKKQKFVRAA